MPAILIDFSQMVDLALATPEMGVINVPVLHSLLQCIVHRLSISSDRVEFHGGNSGRIEELIPSIPSPSPVYLKEFSLSDSKDLHNRKEVTTSNKNSPVKTIITINSTCVADTKPPAGLPLASLHILSTLDMEMLKNRVTSIHDALASVLPDGKQLMLESNDEECPTGALARMNRIINTAKRVDAVEIGLRKMAQMVTFMASACGKPCDCEDEVSVEETDSSGSESISNDTDSDPTVTDYHHAPSKKSKNSSIVLEPAVPPSSRDEQKKESSNETGQQTDTKKDTDQSSPSKTTDKDTDLSSNSKTDLKNDTDHSSNDKRDLKKDTVQSSNSKRDLKNTDQQTDTKKNTDQQTDTKKDTDQSSPSKTTNKDTDQSSNSKNALKKDTDQPNNNKNEFKKDESKIKKGTDQSEKSGTQTDNETSKKDKDGKNVTKADNKPSKAKVPTAKDDEDEWLEAMDKPNKEKGSKKEKPKPNATENSEECKQEILRLQQEILEILKSHSQLESRLNNYETTFSGLIHSTDEEFRCILNKYHNQFLQTMIEVQDMLDAKVDKHTIPALKQFITDTLNEFRGTLEHFRLEFGLIPDAAATTVRKLRVVDCLSCQQPVFQADREQPPYVPLSKPATPFRKLTEPVKRHCGGGHTTTTALERTLMEGNFITQNGPPGTNNFVDMEVGTDGTLYRIKPGCPCGRPK